MAEKSGWLKNALKKSKATEEEKLENFQNYALKVYTKTIKQKKRQLADLQEKFQETEERNEELRKELEEEVINASFDLNLKELDTRMSRETYFKKFDSQVSDTLNELDQFIFDIDYNKEEHQNEIKCLEDIIEKLEKKKALLS